MAKTAIGKRVQIVHDITKAWMEHGWRMDGLVTDHFCIEPMWARYCLGARVSVKSPL